MASESIDMLQARVGEAITAQRLRLNLTRQVVAERSALSLKAVTNLEKGVGASLSTFLAVCRTLGKLDWIDSITPPEGESPLEMWKRLNKPKRQRATARRLTDGH